MGDGNFSVYTNSLFFVAMHTLTFLALVTASFFFFFFFFAATLFLLASGDSKMLFLL